MKIKSRDKQFDFTDLTPQQVKSTKDFYEVCKKIKAHEDEIKAAKEKLKNYEG